MNKKTVTEQEIAEQDLQAISGGAEHIKDEFKRLNEVVPPPIIGASRRQAQMDSVLALRPAPAHNPFHQQPAPQQPPAPQQG